MNIPRPPIPAQHAATQTTPLKLRTTSVPTTGRIFKAEEVNQDLLIELEDATIDEDPLTGIHYILEVCNETSPTTTVNLPSDEASPLKITSLELGNENLYCNDRWEPTMIPQLLRSPLSTGSSQDPSFTGSSWGHGSSRGQQGRGRGRGRGQERGRGSSWTRSHIPDRAGGGVRCEIVQRRIPGTSQEETIAGTFLPTAGSEEQHIASWLNKITCALEDFVPLPPLPESVHPARAVTRSLTAKHRRVWSSETSCKPIKDDLLPLKPDLVLQEPPELAFGPHQEFSWKNVISFMELTSSAYSHSDSMRTVRNGVMRKAYAIFASQPNRCFLFAMSIAKQEFRAHMFDRAGVVHTRPYNIHRHPRVLLRMFSFLAFGPLDQIGYDTTFIPRQLSSPHPRAIYVESTAYDVIDRIFYNFVIHGRGTACWHVCRNKENYVIKDSWTHESRLNREADILSKIRGLKGVPRLIVAWTVQIGGSDDRTDIHHRSLSFPSNI